MDDYPSLCAGATCTNAECCSICPFEGRWQSTSVFGGDALVVTAASERDSGWEVQMANMPMISFDFVIQRTTESTAECQCKISLDTLTIAAGEMSESQGYISWDTILNNDVWEREQDRRLDGKSKRNYEIRDGGLVVFPQERRLQQQDVRMDFEFQTATDNDAMLLQGRFAEMDMLQIEEALRSALAETAPNFTIGSVYRTSDLETETIVIPGSRTSWAARSAAFWFWMPVSAVVAALFLV